MRRDKTILPEESLSMGRMDIGGSKDECVKNNQTEEYVCPASYVSIGVDGQDEHETTRSNPRAKFTKNGSSVEIRR